MNDFGVVTEPGTVRLERILPGPIERVWAYLTESEKRGAWLASGPMELRVGGRVELHFNHAELTPHAGSPPAKYQAHECGSSMHGVVSRCEPPRLLSYSWSEASHDGSQATLYSEVTFELTARGDDVLLVVTHRRLGDQATMISVASGWHAHIGILIDKLNGRAPLPFWSTHAQLEAEYERRFSHSQ